MNGRIYDGLLGRFLSADLVVQNPGDLQCFNRYSYVRNNPLSFTDPTGFLTEDEKNKSFPVNPRDKSRSPLDDLNSQKPKPEIDPFNPLWKPSSGGAPCNDQHLVDNIKENFRNNCLSAETSAADQAEHAADKADTPKPKGPDNAVTAETIAERVRLLQGQADAYDQKRSLLSRMFVSNPYHEEAWQLLKSLNQVGIGIATYNRMVSADQRIDPKTYDFRSSNTAELQRIGINAQQIALILASFGASELSAFGAEANAGRGWVWGSNKGMEKTLRQMEQRGWTPNEITDAMRNGESFPAQNLVNPGNSATRYVNPVTGRSTVIDDVTKEVIHVGGDNFKY